ncbi:hypothetical protein ANN_14265 [Periplaneta americana]|uniref:PiggyBac transposable element-derived protein domain-containing protein n=1 Tax=Periplaneta americana TaxID=6978 RepID=A0ABQ8SWE7_PERAM|nr:hypothetical protein ANN_14265 [Periplaneta americana]
MLPIFPAANYEDCKALKPHEQFEKFFDDVFYNTYVTNLENMPYFLGKNPRSNKEYEEMFGKCTSPLLNMIDDFDPEVQQLPFSFFFDNLFIGFPVLAYLKSRGYTATSTMRENRIPKSCPLSQKPELKKKLRGYITFVKMKDSSSSSNIDIHVTKWVDNAVVTIASTSYGKNPVSKLQWYSKDQRKKLSITRPNVVGRYKKYMCGVDRMDQNVNLYHVGNSGKKLSSCIFIWLIDVCMQNAWQLQRVAEPTMSQLQFRRQIGIYYCNHYGEKPAGPGTVTQKEIFCELNERERSLQEVKQQWRCMKLHAISHYLYIGKPFPGGPKPPSPSKEVVELVEMIPLEFQEDFNEYDSNRPPTNVMTEVPETEREQSCEVPCRPESTSAVLIEDEDDSRKRIAKLAEERSKVLLEQQEAEHEEENGDFRCRTENEN